MTIKSIEPYPEPLATNAGLHRADHWVHSVAPLTGLDETSLTKALGDKTRNMLRQAERAGLAVVRADGSQRSAARWHAVYVRSQHALGLPPFPAAFFETMLAELAPLGLVRLYLVVRANGEAVAGSIVFVEPDRLIYGYSASDPEARNLRPNDLMLFHIMRRALEEGRAHFDFGSDSPLQEGLLFFKRKWLARQAPIPTYTLGTAGQIVDSSAGRYGLVRSVTKRMPLPLVRAAFGYAVRYFG